MCLNSETKPNKMKNNNEGGQGLEENSVYKRERKNYE